MDPLLLVAGGAFLVSALLNKSPLDRHPVNARIVSGFGTRVDPFTGEAGRFHNGIDYAVGIGTALISIVDGVVVQVAQDDRSGRFLLIDGRGKFSGFRISYAHLSHVSVDVGETVSVGQVVAESGNSGKTTGPHLHFRIDRNGQTIDPLSVLPPLEQTGVA